MSFDTSYYGTLVEAEDYFAARLHATAWDDANGTDKPKALWAATKIIDALAFKGYKATVQTLLTAYPHATYEEIRAAEADQVLEFPRGADTDVPEAIRIATYELAYSLLDGRDPELELEALGISNHTYGSVRTQYARDQVPMEHLVNGIPNAQAWRYLRPFLRDSEGVNLSRIN
jgi:hypothetical protein